jgi:hypothetical protein
MNPSRASRATLNSLALHVALLRAHNRIVELLRAARVPEGDIFDQARNTLTWHYQWIAAGAPGGAFRAREPVGAPVPELAVAATDIGEPGRGLPGCRQRRGGVCAVFRRTSWLTLAECSPRS